jgi:two-component system cell cycle sensor histidine kinase/response regulator CckA
MLDLIVRDLTHLPSVGGLVFNIRDVTERCRIEQRYLQAQKMEALGRLVGGVVHDFNNILTAAVGNAELLLEGRMSGDADRLGLQAILDSGMRAVELTSQLLAVTRHRPVAPEVFDLNEAIRLIRPMLAPILGEDVRLIARLCRLPVLVRADPGRIDQVLLNLVVNARDAMPLGGEVTIGTDAVLRHLFEPFYSTKGEGLGSGLGLATVYRIIEQAGGHIEVESSPGVGSTFRVLLPVAEPQPDAPQTVVAAPVEILPVGSTVLVVEDEELVRSLAVRSLQRAGPARLGLRPRHDGDQRRGGGGGRVPGQALSAGRAGGPGLGLAGPRPD